VYTGPFLLAGVSRKQGAVSHSTPEAEIVAADVALRVEGVPALALWDVLLGRPQCIMFHEDNQAAIQVMKTGRNPTMRHLERTHKVCIAWLHDQFSCGDWELIYEVSNKQSADIFTKPFSEPAKWTHACELINLVDHSSFWPAPAHGRGVVPGAANKKGTGTGAPTVAPTGPRGGAPAPPKHRYGEEQAIDGSRGGVSDVAAASPDACVPASDVSNAAWAGLIGQHVRIPEDQAAVLVKMIAAVEWPP